MKHRGIKAWMQKFFCSCVSTASPAGCPCVWNSSVQSQRCLCHTVWERHSYSKALTASVCPSSGHTGPLCPGGYFWGHLKPVQLGSTSGFKGHLKAAISSKETGCSHAGWPKKLILFHGIKGISAIHLPLFEERNGLHVKLQSAHMANKARWISA